MEIKFLPKAEDDLKYWKQTRNKRIMKRISTLLADILEHPFTGIGKRAFERKFERLVESPYHR